MYMSTEARQHTRVCARTLLIKSGAHKWIMISVLTQCVLLKHSGLTAAKEPQPRPSGLSAVRTAQTSLHLLPSSDSALAFLMPYLGRRKATQSTSERARKQDTTRQGQKKWHIQLLTIHYGD